MKKPFFARFLEAQELDSVVAGNKIYTEKYPSDNHENAMPTSPKDDVMTTMKYPSDGDDDPIVIIEP